MHLIGHGGQLLQIPKNQAILDGGLQDAVVVLRNCHAREEIRQDAAGGGKTNGMDNFLHSICPKSRKQPPHQVANCFIPGQRGVSKGALFHPYPNRSASSTRNFGRFESLKALMRTTSSLRWGLLLFRDLTATKGIMRYILSVFELRFIIVHRY